MSIGTRSVNARSSGGSIQDSAPPWSRIRWCKDCGGHVLTEHPQWNLTDVYAATIPDFPFQAGVHVNYQESVLPIHDGLTKLQDLPTEMGGSGVVVAE